MKITVIHKDKNGNDVNSRSEEFIRLLKNKIQEETQIIIKKYFV